MSIIQFDIGINESVSGVVEMPMELLVKIQFLVNEKNSKFINIKFESSQIHNNWNFYLHYFSILFIAIALCDDYEENFQILLLRINKTHNSNNHTIYVHTSKI